MINRNMFREPLSLLGICLLLGMVLSSCIASNALIQAKRSSEQVITVTGSASTNIVSDLASWECRFSQRSGSLKTAYSSLQKDFEVVHQYLLKQGIAEADMKPTPVSTETIFTRDSQGQPTNDVSGYTVEQGIVVTSRQVNRLQQIANQANALINQGLFIRSNAPEFYYTKLDGLKVQMLGEATQNAKQRALSMAKYTHNQIGLMRSAQMGVFQITAPNSTEISDYGVNDTASKEKKITAVVSVSFSVQ
jgi:uncharacterized protein